jgi:hypothetical protein
VEVAFIKPARLDRSCVIAGNSHNDTHEVSFVQPGYDTRGRMAQ